MLLARGRDAQPPWAFGWASLEPGCLSWLDLAGCGPGSRCAFLGPRARVKCNLERAGAKASGGHVRDAGSTAGRFGRPCGVSFAQKALRSPFSKPLLQSSPFPSLSRPSRFQHSTSVWRESGQFEKMKTFLKWHVPVAERWQTEPAGSGAGALSIFKYPKYAPFLAAKPQQCLPASPSFLGPGVHKERRPPRRPGGATVAMGGAAGSLVLGGPLSWGWHMMPGFGGLAQHCFPGVMVSMWCGKSFRVLITPAANRFHLPWALGNLG